MKLKELLQDISIVKLVGDEELEIQNIQLDSREVEEGSLFVAIKGHLTDGHQFIDKAIASGATAVVCETIGEAQEGISYVVVEDASLVLGELASTFYGHPSKKLKLVGITGTNGKTSIASLLYKLFRQLGHKVGLISTIKYSINGQDHHSTHTTPHAVRIQQLLSEMHESGCSHVFMEVSSHAIDQQRIAGLDFDGAVFTNITHDHLDYHKDFKSYLYTKKRFFDGLKTDAFALINADDRNAKVMVQNCKASRYTYGLRSVCDFKTRIIEQDLQSMLLDIRGDEVWLQLVGDFNAYNVLAVYAVAFLLNQEHEDVIRSISLLRSVEGRFQQMQHKGITAIVDYAHTPDALQHVLDSINAIRSKNEQLICVVGCGGDRDRDKRPMMARIASVHADKVILTSDNPRSEDPQSIIDEMMEGVEAGRYKKVLKILDREEAIKTAISLAETGDVILVAGKGHEKYQEIKGVRHPFDDSAVIQQQLRIIHE